MIEQALKPNLPPLDAAAGARKAGCEAYKEGRPVWDCPLEYSKHLNEWQLGWQLAMRMAYRMQKLREANAEQDFAGVSHTARLIRGAVK